MMDTRSRILIIVSLTLIIICVAATYWRTMVLRDYEALDEPVEEETVLVDEATVDGEADAAGDNTGVVPN